MATPLVQRHCVECKPGTAPLSRAEVDRLLAEVPGWLVEEADGHQRLARTVKFKGFMPGVDLINRIAPIAEAEGHHPDLLLTYGSATIWLWTHAAGGLTENDFILASRLHEAISQSLN
jgi:4a-hydroxytetrahydrobiopterin dehydratase